MAKFTIEKRRLYNDRYKAKHPKRVMLSSARSRAALRGLPFDLTEDDIEIPEFCPVLGARLQPGNADWAPTLDRLIPTLGYVASNCQVISNLANRIKNSAGGTEIMKVALWVIRETPWEPEPHE